MIEFAQNMTRVFALIAMLVGSAAGAEPTGEELLDACSVALSNDFQGLEAAMCDWYVTPCPCNFKGSALLAAGEWCLPENVDSRTVARQVVDTLGARRDDLQHPASALVIPLLRDVYPCAE